MPDRLILTDRSRTVWQLELRTIDAGGRRKPHIGVRGKAVSKHCANSQRIGQFSSISEPQLLKLLLKLLLKQLVKLLQKLLLKLEMVLFHQFRN